MAQKTMIRVLSTEGSWVKMRWSERIRTTLRKATCLLVVASLCVTSIPLNALPAFAADVLEAATAQAAADAAGEGDLDQHFAAAPDFAQMLDSMEPGVDYVEGQMLATVTDEGRRQLSSQGLSVFDDLGETVVVEVSSSTDLAAAMSAAENLAGVCNVQPNFRYHALEDADPISNDPRVGEQTYLSQINVAEAWQLVRQEGAVPITVAVADTGCRLDHEDLRETVLADLAYDCFNDCPLASSSVQDVSAKGHGTHICGIIGAQSNNGKGVAGIGLNVKVLPLRVFDDDGSASTATIIEALEKMESYVDEGKVTNLRLLNLSVGAYLDDYSGSQRDEVSAEDVLLNLAIQKARTDYGILSVCAGGNGASGFARTDYLFPSDYEACLSVTSVTDDGFNSKFSDYNAAKDISAPGEGLLSTVGVEYKTMSGTSMAAPVVTGTLALMFAVNPSMSCDDAFQAIRETASPVNNAQNSHVGETGSAGIVNAGAAIARAIEIRNAASAAPHTHSWGSWQCVKEPTVYQVGTSKRTCSDCEAVQSVSTGVASLSIKLANTQYSYCGKRIRPAVSGTVSFTDGRSRALMARDYSVTYKNNLYAGKKNQAVAVISTPFARASLERHFTIGKATQKLRFAKSTTLKKTFSAAKKGCYKGCLSSAKSIKSLSTFFGISSVTRRYFAAMSVSKWSSSKSRYVCLAKGSSAKKYVRVSELGGFRANKGLRRGLYKVAITVYARETTNYAKTPKRTIYLKVMVK